MNDKPKIKNDPENYITVGMVQDRNRKEYLASRVNGPLEEVAGYIPEAFPMSSDYNKFDPIDYALHYGGRCRDCADADGVCPSSGMPCDPAEARKAAGHVLKAWKYGIEHGYMDNPLTAAIRRIKPSEAEGRD